MYSKSLTTAAVLTLVMMGLAGCSRTVEDVSRWEEAGKVEKLTEALVDPKAEVRIAALQSLGTLKAETAIDTISACFNDAEDNVVLAAVKALASMESLSTITPLIAALKLDNATARIVAADALGALKAPSAVKPLAEFLETADEDEQLTVIKALASIGREEGSQPLADLFKANPSMQIRMASLDALPKTGGAVAWKALVNALADNNMRIREAARSILIQTGRPVIPSVIDGLSSGNTMVRSESIKLLSDLGAVPESGRGLVWYQLARWSLTEDTDTSKEIINLLVSKGTSVIPTLIEAASLDVDDIREPAAEVLEWMGESALEDVMDAAGRIASRRAKEWLGSRTDWVGAPSVYLDFFAAVSALNPDFPAPEDSKAMFISNAKTERAFIPDMITSLDQGTDEEKEWTIRKLKAAGPSASLPLLAAITSSNTVIAEAAATIMEERKDPRAYEALANALQQRVDAGDPLSNSPIYTALINLNRPEAEPLLMKVRPNTARAIQLFERQYPAARVIGADTTDPYTDNEAPVSIHLAYVLSGAPGSLDVTFRKDVQGNWHPSPALPDKLP